MQPIQINVSVNIGVTSELNGLLLSLLSRPQVEAPTAAPAQRKQRTAKQQPVVENKETQQETAPVEEPEQTAETKAETAAPVENARENKVYTVVDVRAAIDRTRKRIEGENWKENPDSEGYKKWHRQLTAWFKNTAAICGADKPSALPDGESCQKFVAICDDVYVKDDELVEPLPY